MSNKTRKKQLKQIENQTQQGRSMVEMLGVLAVIGVISLGGISGYRMAMNRYQANQIANEINLMRTDAKMKVAQGAEELLLGDPYDDEKHLKFNANYGVEVGFEEIETDTPGKTETGYSFALSGIPAGVCRPLATLLDGMDDTAALEINGKDYETVENLCDNEENELVVAFSTKDIGGETKCNPDKCEGKCTEAGECEPCPEGTIWDNGECTCPSGKHLKDDMCITCPASKAEWNDEVGDCVCTDPTKHWNGASCEACDSSTGGTWENGKCICPEGKVLQISNGKCVENMCNGGEGCSADAEGNPQYCDMHLIACNGGNPVPDSSGHQCSTVEGKYAKVEIENGAGDKKIIYNSNSTMDWWAADAFCRALGKRLMRLEEDLGCTPDDYCKAGSYGKALADKLQINGNGWTSTFKPSDSCYAYTVNLTHSHIKEIVRYSSDKYSCYALCE